MLVIEAFREGSLFEKQGTLWRAVDCLKIRAVKCFLLTVFPSNLFKLLL